MHSLFYYLLTVVIWGSSWFVITFQLGVVHEVVSVFYRFAMAAALLLLYCLIKSKRMQFTFRENVFMALQGVFLFCLNYVLIYWGTAYIPSGLMAVVFSTLMAMNIFNGAIFLQRPVRPVVVIGALFGLAGISLVFGQEIVSAGDGMQAAQTWKGLLLGLAATYSASLGNILSARNQQAGVPVLQSNAYGMLYGAIVLLAYALLSGVEFNMDWRMEYVLSMAALVVLGTIVAFGAYLTLVGQIGADKAGYAMVVFPLVALLISTLFENFTWTPMAIGGVLLVLLGNLFVVGRRAIGELSKGRKTGVAG